MPEPGKQASNQDILNRLIEIDRRGLPIPEKYSARFAEIKKRGLIPGSASSLDVPGEDASQTRIDKGVFPDRQPDQQPINTASPDFAIQGQEKAAQDIKKPFSVRNPVNREIQEKLNQIPEFRGGVLAGEDPLRVSELIVPLITSFDPSEFGEIIRSNFDNISVTQSPDGQIILTNNKTGVKEIVNKPKLSGTDVAQSIGTMGLYALGGLPTAASKGLGGLFLKAGNAALTESGIQGTQELAGGQFNPEDVALAAGFQVGGDVIGQGVGSGIKALRSANTPLPEAEAQLLAQADELDIPVFTSDVIKSRASEIAQNVGEKVPVIGTRGPRAEQQGAREAAVDDYLFNFPRAEVGEVAQSLKSRKDTVFNAARSSFENLANEMRAAPPSIPLSVNRQVRDELETFADPALKKDPVILGVLKEESEALTKSQSYETLRSNRTMLGEKMRSKDVTPTQYSVMKRIYDAYSKELEERVFSELGENGLRRYKNANKKFADEADNYIKAKNKKMASKVARILNDSKDYPNAYKSMLQGTINRAEDAKKLYSLLTPRGKRAVKNTIVNDAFDKARGSTARFITELEKQSPATNVFFTQAEKDVTVGLINVLRATERAGELTKNVRTGQSAVDAGIFGSGAINIAATLKGLLAGGVFARVYESPAMRNYLLKYRNVQPGSAREKKLLSLLPSAIQSLRLSLEKEKNQKYKFKEET